MGSRAGESEETHQTVISDTGTTGLPKRAAFLFEMMSFTSNAFHFAACAQAMCSTNAAYAQQNQQMQMNLIKRITQRT
jgi:hypothetical protein